MQYLVICSRSSAKICKKYSSDQIQNLNKSPGPRPKLKIEILFVTWLGLWQIQGLTTWFRLWNMILWLKGSGMTSSFWRINSSAGSASRSSRMSLSWQSNVVTIFAQFVSANISIISKVRTIKKHVNFKKIQNFDFQSAQSVTRYCTKSI